MKATRDSFGEFILEKAKIDKNLFVLDSDLTKATKTEEFSKVYPTQFCNTGICEQNMVGVASGMAIMKKNVYACSFAIFLTSRAHEIIRNSVCYQNLGVKLIGSHAGISVGYDGGSHQAIEDIAIMNALPNMSIFTPCDDIQTKAILDYVHQMKTPAYVRLGRTPVKNVYDNDYKYEFGISDVVSHGEDLLILTHGLMVQTCVDAATKSNKSVKVINVSTIKPFNKEDILSKVETFREIIVIEEHSIIGGLGDIVCANLINHNIKVDRLGINDVFGESGSPDDLLKKHKLDVCSIIDYLNSK